MSNNRKKNQKKMSKKNSTRQNKINSFLIKSLVVFCFSLILLSGILTFAPKKDIKKISSAIQGSLQRELTPSSSDLFSCGGRDDCTDDKELLYAEAQHKYVAQAYDKFGFPLTGIKYEWTQEDNKDLIKYRDLDSPALPVDKSESAIGDTDQEIYVQPNQDNLRNGSAVVDVLAYQSNNKSQGKNKSIDVSLFFCLNTWPSTSTFPFVDDGSPRSTPYTNFQTYYCKDRGSIINPSDDYPALKIVERGSNLNYDFTCSGGNGNGLSCTKDYFISYNGSWTGPDNLSNYASGPPTISSPNAIAINGLNALVVEGNKWAYYSGGWTNGDLDSSFPFANWPDGPKPGTPLKPTAIGWDNSEILLIENNSYSKSLDGGATWSNISTLSANNWPENVQSPNEVAEYEKGGYQYLMALKGDNYRVYSDGNLCNKNKKCQNQAGRIWGSCKSNNDCYWGELFSLFDVREYPTSVLDWKKKIRGSLGAIGLTNNNILLTSSCESGGGVCLIKEFLLISNPACDDEIDNDGDGTCDWAGGDCIDKNGDLVTGMSSDPDCNDPSDNSESGTCDDGIDNDNDSKTDYPNDFSCSSYSDIEESSCSPSSQCCDNIDNDNDGLIDQQDGGCDSATDTNEINLCNNGIDDDGDGLIDISDPGCKNASDNDERGITQCDDGKDNDGDGKSDYPDDLGCDRPGDDQELDN